MFPKLYFPGYNPREVILSALLRTGQQAPFYIFITFVLAYGSATLGLDQGFMLNTTFVAAAISCFTFPFRVTSPISSDESASI